MTSLVTSLCFILTLYYSVCHSTIFNQNTKECVVTKDIAFGECWDKDDVKVTNLNNIKTVKEGTICQLRSGEDLYFAKCFGGVWETEYTDVTLKSRKKRSFLDDVGCKLFNHHCGGGSGVGPPPPPPIICSGHMTTNPSNGTVWCTSGYNDGSTCAFNCSSNYQLVGEWIVRCSGNQWSHSKPTCQDMEPPKFPSGCPDYVTQFAAEFGSNTRVFYHLPPVTDNSGQQVSLMGNPQPGSVFNVGRTTVNITATDSAWNVASCYFTVEVVEVTCQDPLNENIDNSTQKLMVFHCPLGHKYGAKCALSCKDGKPVYNPTDIKCEKNPNGTGYWYWNNPKPYCGEIQCPDPRTTTIDNTPGRLMEFNCSNGHVYGSKCSLSCSDGNHVQIRKEIICQLNATTHTGYWDYGSIKPYCDDKLCPVITPPGNGSVSCGTIYSKQTCTLQCHRGYAFPVYQGQDGYFICQNGMWTPQRPIDSDSCQEGRIPRGSKFTADIWYYNSNCSQNNTEIKHKFIGIINDTRILKDFCKTHNMACQLDHVNVTCGPHNRKRSSEHGKIWKRSTSLITKAAFVINIRMNDTNMGLTKDKVHALVNGINKQYAEGTMAGKYDIPEAGTTNSMSFGPGVAEYICPASTLFQPRAQELLCVGCGKGFIYVPGQDFCSICPKGTYQPSEEADTCLPCPDNTTTKAEGAGAVDMCLDLCLPGQYSPSGYQPCGDCPRGSYQENTMSRSCLPCPDGFMTDGTGATSQSDCKQQLVNYEQTICVDGQDLDISCGDDKLDVIQLRTAIYGRANQGKCPGERPGNVTCTGKDVTLEVAARCDGNVSCSYPVSFKDFGDPCVDYTKSLVVTYNCLLRKTTQ